jgi:hypothetical protein
MFRLFFAIAFILLLSSCGTTDADVASASISQAADNFQIVRRIVFYNGITGEYMLSIEGLCSISSAHETAAVAITCKTSQTEYKKHFLGLSDNVTYFAEQLEPAAVGVYRYKVTFKPSVIVPDIQLR